LLFLVEVAYKKALMLMQQYPSCFS
jgi:hypothetical protein